MLPAACDRLRCNYFRPFVFRPYLYRWLLHLYSYEHRGARHSSSSNQVCQSAVYKIRQSCKDIVSNRDSPNCFVIRLITAKCHCQSPILRAWFKTTCVRHQSNQYSNQNKYYTRKLLAPPKLLVAFVMVRPSSYHSFRCNPTCGLVLTCIKSNRKDRKTCCGNLWLIHIDRYQNGYRDWDQQILTCCTEIFTLVRDREGNRIHCFLLCWSSSLCLSRSRAVGINHYIPIVASSFIL